MLHSELVEHLVEDLLELPEHVLVLGKGFDELLSLGMSLLSLQMIVYILNSENQHLLLVRRETAQHVVDCGSLGAEQLLLDLDVRGDTASCSSLGDDDLCGVSLPRVLWLQIGG